MSEKRGCDYCEDGKCYYDEHMNKAMIAERTFGAMLEVETDGIWAEIEIKRCLWCGKEL
jgi:hypothetical protein